MSLYVMPDTGTPRSVFEKGPPLWESEPVEKQLSWSSSGDSSDAQGARELSAQWGRPHTHKPAAKPVGTLPGHGAKSPHLPS